jgi:hypothetical protein
VRQKPDLPENLVPSQKTPKTSRKTPIYHAKKGCPEEGEE